MRLLHFSKRILKDLNIGQHMRNLYLCVIKYLTSALALLVCGQIQGDSCCDACPLPRHQFFVGPEIYTVKRSRDGGSVQTGVLYGGRLGYDYIRRYAFYAGLDGLYAQGTLNGHSGEGRALSSLLTDANVEGRFGYTFQSKACHHVSFTPYVGYGYFWETNSYKHPSPISVHFHNHFSYIPVGFLSRFFLYPDLSLGLNVKARLPLEGKTKVTNDPDADHLTLHYEQHIQYRIDLPVVYYFCWRDQSLAIGIVPFYEYRHYGYHANFPHDFLDTKFRLYGGNLQLLYVF